MFLQNANGHVLVAIGLLGMAGYEMALRLFHPPVLSDDFVHGIWTGASLGLEIVGMFLINKSRHRTA